jgi:uncharacterized protein (TIGR02145 family)
MDVRAEKPKDKCNFIKVKDSRPKILYWHTQRLPISYHEKGSYHPFSISNKEVLNPSFTEVKKINAKRFLAHNTVRKPKHRKKFLENPESLFMQNEEYEKFSEFYIPKENLPRIKLANSNKFSLKSDLIEFFDWFLLITSLTVTLDKFLPKKLAVYITLLTFVSIPLFSCSGGSDSPSPTPTPTPTPVVNNAPTANGYFNKNYGEIGDTFTFNSDTSNDDTSGLKSRWDFDGNGTYETSYADFKNPVNYIFTQGGNYNPIVEVKDAGGKTAKKTLGNLGVLDPANNPISVELQVPKYIVAGEQIKSTVVAIDENSRPLVYSFDWGIGSGNVVDSNNNQASKTYSNNDVGKKTLEGFAMNDYKIENKATKDVEIGSVIPQTNTVTDDIDGKKYKASWMDDGRVWMNESFAAKVGDAPFYENDSLNYSVFGRYYTAEQVDAIGTRIMTLNGVEHKFRVPTTDEWDNLRRAYMDSAIGGGAGGKSKYVEFANGENFGATNENGMSLMLGGGWNPIENKFIDMGEKGYFYLKVGSDIGRMAIVSKDNDNMPRGPPNLEVKAPVRLIMDD